MKLNFVDFAMMLRYDNARYTASCSYQSKISSCVLKRKIKLDLRGVLLKRVLCVEQVEGEGRRRSK